MQEERKRHYGNFASVNIISDDDHYVIIGADDETGDDSNARSRLFTETKAFDDI